MDQLSQTVLALLRSALWGEENVYPADTDWTAITKELQAQAVLGVVAGSSIPESVPANTRVQWESAALFQGVHFYQLLHAQDELLALLDRNDIHTVILKGMAAAVYYPNPEMRAMGDIDFLVPREHVEKTYELMLANGYALYQEKDANNKHIVFQKGEARFELHRYFGKFDSIDRMELMDSMIQTGLQSIIWQQCAESNVPMLSKLENGLVLLEHAAGHIRDGLGLRHITDWMLYVHSSLTDALWEKSFCQAAQALGLDVFAKVLTKMCQLYLGLSRTISWCQDADVKCCDQLMRYVLEQGNFGGKHTDVGSKVTRVLSDRKSLIGWMRHLQSSGLCHWAAAKNHVLLRPFAWIYGGCRYAYLTLGRKHVIAQLRSEKLECGYRKEMLKNLGLAMSKRQVVLRNNRFVEQKR